MLSILWTIPAMFLMPWDRKEICWRFNIWAWEKMLQTAEKPHRPSKNLIRYYVLLSNRVRQKEPDSSRRRRSSTDATGTKISIARRIRASDQHRTGWKEEKERKRAEQKRKERERRPRCECLNCITMDKLHRGCSAYRRAEGKGEKTEEKSPSSKTKRSEKNRELAKRDAAMARARKSETEQGGRRERWI